MENMEKNKNQNNKNEKSTPKNNPQPYKAPQANNNTQEGLQL